MTPKRVNIIKPSLILIATLFVLFSCNKNESGSILNNETKSSNVENRLATISGDNEIMIYEDRTEAKQIDSKTFLLGGNTKKVTTIGYGHSLLNKLKSSNEWKNVIDKLELNLNDIKRTYLHSSSISLVSIPILQKNNEGEYFNIYIFGNSFLITKFSQYRNINGNLTLEVKSLDNELYYKFDLNYENKIGNWSFQKEIPFKTVFMNEINSEQNRPAAPCASMPFNACMNCFVIETCGSDWVCAVACGLFIPSCIGGAAAACVILH